MGESNKVIMLGTSPDTPIFDTRRLECRFVSFPLAGSSW